MVTTTCDVCKKKVDNPMTGRSFYYYAAHGMCEPCRINLESHIKTAVRNKEPFATEWYNKFVEDSVSKAVQKGRG